MTTSTPARIVADCPLPPAILELLGERVEVQPWSVAEAGSQTRIDGIYTYDRPTVDSGVLARLPGVKVVSNNGVGVDHIDVAAATALGIPVGNTPGVLDGATADLGLALMLAAGRRLMQGDRFARSAEFVTGDPGYIVGREIYGQTLGIIGLGRIGQQVAKRARGLEMTILYHNRNRCEDLESTLGVTYAGLTELLTTSDYVMLCVPLNEATVGLIGQPELSQMKSTAILINIARGAVVDTAALTDALQNGDIYAAALDVTEPEPLPRDHPLLGFDNVTITPHLGTATEQTRQRMNEVSVENLFRGLQGKPLLHEVKR